MALPRSTAKPVIVAFPFKPKHRTADELIAEAIAALVRAGAKPLTAAQMADLATFAARRLPARYA